MPDERIQLQAGVATNLPLCLHADHAQPCSLCASAPDEGQWHLMELAGDKGAAIVFPQRTRDACLCSVQGCREEVKWKKPDQSCPLQVLMSSFAGKKNGAKLLWKAIRASQQWSSVTLRQQAVCRSRPREARTIRILSRFSTVQAIGEGRAATRHPIVGAGGSPPFEAF